MVRKGITPSQFSLFAATLCGVVLAGGFYLLSFLLTAAFESWVGYAISGCATAYISWGLYEQILEVISD